MPSLEKRRSSFCILRYNLSPVRGRDPTFSPTTEIYSALQLAFDWFNAALFRGALPPTVVVLCSRGDWTHGYYSPGRFSAKNGECLADEIGLNPLHFASPVETTLASFAHQLVHHWQQHYDKTCRPTYHNRRWASMMLDIGLQPSHDGQPGGRETGQAMSQYILPNGRFATSCASLIGQGFDVLWTRAMHDQANPLKEKSMNRRIKYACPNCSMQAWADQNATLACSTCRTDLVRVSR